MAKITVELETGELQTLIEGLEHLEKVKGETIHAAVSKLGEVVLLILAEKSKSVKVDS